MSLAGLKLDIRISKFLPNKANHEQHAAGNTAGSADNSYSDEAPVSRTMKFLHATTSK